MFSKTVIFLGSAAVLLCLISVAEARPYHQNRNEANDGGDNEEVPLPEIIFDPDEWTNLFFWPFIWLVCGTLKIDVSHFISARYKRRVALASQRHGVHFFTPAKLAFIWVIFLGVAGAANFLFWRNFPTVSVWDIISLSMIFAHLCLLVLWGLLQAVPGLGGYMFLTAFTAWATEVIFTTLTWVKWGYVRMYGGWVPAMLWTIYFCWLSYSLYCAYFYYKADKECYRQERLAGGNLPPPPEYIPPASGTARLLNKRFSLQSRMN